MKIQIIYELCTDGDISLRKPEKFGCTGQNIEVEDEYFDYIGNMTFENSNDFLCKEEAQNFLEKLLCDGVRVSHSHYYLIKDFYEIIDYLINFINDNNEGLCCKELKGNWDKIQILVQFI